MGAVRNGSAGAGAQGTLAWASALRSHEVIRAVPGLVTFINVLTASATLLNTQDQVAQSAPGAGARPGVAL
jgi:hypothetical protein